MNIQFGLKTGCDRPRGQVIYLCVGHPGPWYNRSFVENPVFTGVGLSDVKVPMSSGDGTGPCTHVRAAMLVWVTCPVLKNHSCCYQGSGCLSN
jgi:hypothetical protein